MRRLFHTHKWRLIHVACDGMVIVEMCFGCKPAAVRVTKHPLLLAQEWQIAEDRRRCVAGLNES